MTTPVSSSQSKRPKKKNRQGGMHLPSGLLDHLCTSVSGFSDEKPQHQWALTRMLWSSTERNRRHCQYDGSFRFSKRDARAVWGSDKYMRDVVGSRYFSVLAGNNVDGYENAFKPSRDMAAALQACIADRRPDDLVDGIGKVQRTFPRAIASRSTDGKRNSVWGGISPANSVQVDEASLTALRRTLVSEALAQRGDPEAQGAVERLIVIKGQLQEVDVLLKLSRNTVAPGYVPLRYAEAKTGRLFGLGPSLQNASRCVRNAALAGCCDYDISNCHWAFVYARAVAAGCPCPVIEEYLSNKASVRGAIASAANISVDQAKECLLMTIFGAPRTVRKQDAIPSTIGVEAARRLYKVPAFQELHGEIGKARKAILQAWKPSGGGFVNAVGLRILASKSAPKRFAHLLQGMEALALMEVVRDQGENVQVCVHDGWVTRHQVSRSHMESIIKRALGCPVQLEERRLDPVLFDHAAHSDVDLAALDAWPADDLVQTANGQQSEQSCGVAADFDHFCASKDEQEEYVDPWAPEAGSPIQPSIILTLRPGWNCNNDKMIGPRARRK